MPLPDNGVAFGGLWSLSATQILLAGQGGADSESGSIALWGSSDGGHTWKQFSDPAFVGLPRMDMGFFDLAATRGGQRIFGPSLGGTLALGEVGSGQADMVALTIEKGSGPTLTSGSPAPIVYPERQ
jgi:hypothetical protein